LGPDDILVIEGIHGLNDKMSYALPTESKYKIYISALTTLNVDEHNRIPTTDGRLLRRMVRDARTRGASAKRTIEMWASVRRGEEENIFPFQESADAMFNSAMIYELSALKQFAEPLLFNIQIDEPEYDEAKTVDAMKEIAVQVGGKLKTTVFVPVDCEDEVVIAAATADQKIQHLMEGKQIVRTIVVKNKLINLILK